MNQSVIESARLRLRPFDVSDARDVQRLAGAFEIADTTMNIPHPYEDGMAEAWISTHVDALNDESGLTCAIEERATGRLVGAIGFKLDKQENCADLGYWIGLPFWNQGYATEAARALIDFGFRKLRLTRISAWHLKRNPASGKVMQKAGMKEQWSSNDRFVKDGKPEPSTGYLIERNDWPGLQTE